MHIKQNLVVDLVIHFLSSDFYTQYTAPYIADIKYNPLFWFLNGSLTAYQKIISPQISAGCLYETSCSRFSRKAIHEFGIIKGVVLTADRLSRCNRISAAGIHRDKFTSQGLIVDEPYMYRFR